MNRILILFIIIIFTSCSTKIVRFYPDQICKVTASSSFVREKPNIKSKILLQLNHGSLLTDLFLTNIISKIKNHQNYWYKITLDDSSTGYIFGGFLEPVQFNSNFINNREIILKSIISKYDNGYEAAKAIEKYQLSNQSDFFNRNNNGLAINLINEKKLYYPNNDDEKGDHYCYYDFLNDIGYYLVEDIYYEGGDFLLINFRNGFSKKINNIPLFSPNTNRFLIASYGVYSINHTEIWKINKTNFEKECELLQDSRDDSEIREVKWINNEKIIITKLSSETKSPINYTIIFSNNNWLVL